MRRLVVVLALLATPAFGGEPEGKKAPPPTPIVSPPTPLSDKVLSLQRLQARMAQGDASAYAEERTVLKAIGAAIVAAGPDAFKSRAERDAVVIYLLSGGQPKDVARVFERADFLKDERDLLRGAAGYASGRTTDAEALLPFNANALSLRLGAQLAYAQSVLLTSKDPAKALARLDLARLLAPGSLIEEAALRREILLVGDLRDPDRVALLARQYVERFSRSLYASNFVEGLSDAAVRFDLCANVENLNKFAALLTLTPPEQARVFLLAVARASALVGRFDVASQAARRMLKVGTPAPAEAARARLYDAISRFPGMSDDEALGAFAAVEAEKLPTADRALLMAASYVREHMREPAPLGVYADTWREAQVAAAHSPELPRDAKDPATAMIQRAVAAAEAARTLGGKENAP